MLIVGSLSGIQDFLFDVRESEGGQAASLRFRSLRLQLIVECIARRVLWELDLPEEKSLLFSAAGKFAVDAPAVSSCNLDAIREEVENWLLTQTHGRLKFAIAATDAIGTAAQCNDQANLELRRRKLSPFAGRSLVVATAFDLENESARDEALERKSRDHALITLSADTAGADETIVGVSVRFVKQRLPNLRRYYSAIPMTRLARHTPKDDRGALTTFVELAQRSSGAPMLGVLKADADSLGAAIRKRLGTSPTFEPLQDFSRKLDKFFGHDLHQMMSAPGSAFSLIYTVFAGGDDLLLVGPWNIIIDFAVHLREAFMREFRTDGLTISAGCAVIKPKFPIRLAAQQAEELLERAKSGSKDQFALFGDCWRWSDHEKIIGTARKLTNWVEQGVIERGWLQTLLELTLLQRQSANAHVTGTKGDDLSSAARSTRIVPAMASSRLTYHVARNWPTPQAEDLTARAARRWIDDVRGQFDRFPITADPIALHLAAVIRYALLATRLNAGEP